MFIPNDAYNEVSYFEDESSFHQSSTDSHLISYVKTQDSKLVVKMEAKEKLSEEDENVQEIYTSDNQVSSLQFYYLLDLLE